MDARRSSAVMKVIGNFPDVLVELVQVAMAAGTKARYLLFDSWFAAPVTIRRIRALGMHAICVLKDRKPATIFRATA